jgi:riboflavin kinase/FMN adenylyltransferase
MTIDQQLAQASPLLDTAITIGVFDGVHLGHQWLLQRLRTLASAKGLLSLALTFRNHPRNVLRPEVKLGYITTLDDRIDLIRAQGVDQVVAVEFTREVSMLRAPEFVELLSRHLRMRGLLVGPDFALGHGREGDVSSLRSLGDEMGFWVEQAEPVGLGTGIVRSSVTRDLIAAGEVKAAGDMLGRRYSLTGTVVPGDRRGRTLGFPTANLDLDADLVLPADGIYATWALIDGRRHQAATCIGVRPTFGVSGRTVEAFILDFDEDLYGKPVTLEFAGRLRDEEAFSTVDALIRQMNLDVEQTRDLLSGLPETVADEAPADAAREG